MNQPMLNWLQNKLRRLKGSTLDEVAKKTTENAKKLFDIN